MKEKAYVFKLKALRAEYEVTQVELAKALNVAPSTIFYWENNLSSPSGEMLLQIADYFGIPMDWLYGRFSRFEGELGPTQKARGKKAINRFVPLENEE